MNQYPKRLIEVDLPIKRISAHARREKSIRHGHISTLHIWWARRPLAACRAVICASLWFDPADEKCPESFRQAARDAMRSWGKDHRTLMSSESFEAFEKANKDAKLYEDNVYLRSLLLDFIADFANWDNSTNEHYLETSRGLTDAAHIANGGEPGMRPLVVDPFAGGGAIPLEALRVGADAFASDLNPVAVLLNKVVLEYIPKYGQQLADDVREWGQSIKNLAEQELEQFYPQTKGEKRPTTYLWARTVLSEAPGYPLPVEIPLLRSLWITKKSKKRAYQWRRDSKNNIVVQQVTRRYADGTERDVLVPQIDIVEAGATNVEAGTSVGGAAICPITKFATPVESVRRQLKERLGGAADGRLLCVVADRPTGTGRTYRAPNQHDLLAVDKAAGALNSLVASGHELPSGEINHLRGFFNVVLYGMTQWGHLFSPRQAVALLTLVRLLHKVRRQLPSDDRSLAILTCLAMCIDRCADKCASLVPWNVPGEKVEHVFGRQALPMVWDYAEASILSSIGWDGALEWVMRAIESNTAAELPVGHAEAASATSHPLPNDTADALVTDPPYYAAIPYADLSDFFYSWLKKTVGHLHSSLFTDELSPKIEECIQMSHRAASYRHKDSAWFEKQMSIACSEGCRYTKPMGIGVFVFANKETSGWEAMLGALITANWTITASWPIDTEFGGRLRAQNSAALASSIHLVCRPRENADGSVRMEIGDWRNVLRELPVRIHEWMPRLADEGVVGADAIFACLGPALEIFSRYSSVEKPSGEIVALREYLEHVWAAVAKEALEMIFSGADTAGFESDSRLTAMWLWTLFSGVSTTERTEDPEEESDVESNDGRKKATGYILEYDAARKIAQGLGAHLEDLSSIIEVKGDKARLLPVSERARDLFGFASSSTADAKKKKKSKAQAKLFTEMEDDEYESAFGIGGAPTAGATTLDKVHQTMLLFGAGRGEAVKRFLVDDGIGKDERFWRLADNLSKLYPSGSQEKRWVDGVLARKKGLGF